MRKAFRLWRSLRRNKTFRGWIEETFTMEEIRRMPGTATACDLHERWEMFEVDVTSEQWQQQKDEWEGLVRNLYGRYGKEIWWVCLPEMGALGPNEDAQVGLDKLVGLDLADQVAEPKMFEEFMVRNAFKLIAMQILKDVDAVPREN